MKKLSLSEFAKNSLSQVISLDELNNTLGGTSYNYSCVLNVFDYIDE